MIELKENRLVFSFPEVHRQAKLSISFQRTLRIPDDGQTYPLPPGLGSFPLRHIDDLNVPPGWREKGGVVLPMYQSEALWLLLDTSYIHEHSTTYPFAIKVAAGKINAVTGENWEDALSEKPQDYLVSPDQPWLDGYNVGNNLIRQFVAMPLSSGYTAEEQISGKAEHGGLQLAVYPMKREVFEQRFPRQTRIFEDAGLGPHFQVKACEIMESAEMGLAPGGKMEQEIYEDLFGFDDWHRHIYSRCFVHIANSLVWRAISGDQPPTVPYTAREYANYGLPWFHYYNDSSAALEGSEILGRLKSIIELGKEKKERPLPENEAVKPERIINLGTKKPVREGHF